MDPFIRLYPEVIDAALCTEIVNRFQSDSRRHAGQVGSGYSTAKRSTDLVIATLPEWAELCANLDQPILESLRRYRVDVPNFADTHRTNLRETDYRVQCYEPNGRDGFDWHADVASRSSADRVLAMIAYLNDVADGGETEFRAQGVKIAPRRGAILWFPPTFSYLHRGNVPVSEAKYVITCFLRYA